MLKRSYANKTFDELLNDVIRHLRDRGVVIASRSDISYILLESMAYLVENLLFYLDAQFNELFIDTAVTPESIINLAYQMGYQRRGAEPFTLIVDNGTDVNTDAVTIGGETFTKLVKVGSVSINTDFYKWPGKSESYYFEGQIQSQVVDRGTLDWAFREIWLSVPAGFQPAHNFIYMKAGEEQFVVYDGFVTSSSRNYFLARYYDNGIKVILGDGDFFKLPATSQITFYYLVTRGATFLPAFDLTNLTYINGVNIESIESIRLYAPRFYWISDRFITLEDVKEGIKRYNPSYVAHVTSNRGRGWERPKVSVLVFKRGLVGLIALDNSELSNLKNYISKRIPFGSDVEVVSDTTRIISVNVIVDAYLQSLANPVVIEQAIKDVISDIFGRFEFGTSISVGDIWGKVNETAGVESAFVSFEFPGNASAKVIRLPSDSRVPLIYQVPPDYIFGLSHIKVNFHKK